ncbi:MAG: hypothetical protein ACREPV_08360 [Lysobacter sp.]
MTRFKLSTLSLALLGGLALTACDNTPNTAAVDTYEADTTAATEPVEPIEDTAPVADINDPTATSEYDTADPTTTMGDVNEYPMEEQDPTAVPEPDPMDPQLDDQQDLEEPVDETPTPQ